MGGRGGGCEEGVGLRVVIMGGEIVVSKDGRQESNQKKNRGGFPEWTRGRAGVTQRSLGRTRY